MGLLAVARAQVKNVSIGWTRSTLRRNPHRNLRSVLKMFPNSVAPWAQADLLELRKKNGTLRPSELGSVNSSATYESLPWLWGGQNFLPLPGLLGRTGCSLDTVLTELPMRGKGGQTADTAVVGRDKKN
jgi:hypothetical protein